MNSKFAGATGRSRNAGFFIMLALLVVVIMILLGGAFLPGRTLFSNDGPLGRLMSSCHRLPDSFNGVWEDLNSVGYAEQGALPNITCGLRLLLHPILFSKFYVATALLILGLAAWCFFRELRLAPAACILGGLAAAMNSEFFSTACWGIGSHPLTIAMAFFAMAALLKTGSWRSWLYVLVAGAAVGMGLTEGADVGAIFSIYVASFAMYNAWISEGSRVKNFAVGAFRVSLVAGFAALVAAQAIFALVHTQVEGIAGMAQDEQSKVDHWLWATRWSLPKREALGLVVPGLFGYRMDTPNGGGYWGALGRSPAWEKYLANGGEGKRPTDILRQTGSGIYTGVAVVLLAIWAALQSFRRKDSVFNDPQRKWIWFWFVVLVGAMLLGFGRHAPFYALIYQLPYLSTIRNPVKFFAIVNFAFVILFAYGVDGLWRTYLAPLKTAAPRRSPETIRFDKLWMRGCLVVLGMSMAAWLMYANSSESLRMFLESEQIPTTRATEVASFSIMQVGWFVLFFSLTSAVLWLMMRGHFAGARAKWGAIAIGFLLVVDLGRADQPWIISWDYKNKYATNPVLDMLKDRPYEHRVSLLRFPSKTHANIIQDLYRFEWSQHEFQYYDIQSFDLVQLPRAPQDLDAFRIATYFDGSIEARKLLLRRWEITNTRYLLGSADLLEGLNLDVDRDHGGRFRIAMRFDLVPKTEIDLQDRMGNFTAVPDLNGPYAVFEFTGASPRAKLCTTWQVSTNMQDSLHLILSDAFNPARDLLVAGGLPASAVSRTNTVDPGTVEFLSYEPKKVALTAHAKTPCILLLNDRVDPNWRVSVDGKAATMLRCNYFMRGVWLEPGQHRVEFWFSTPPEALHISLAALAVTLAVLGMLVATGYSKELAATEKTPTPPLRPEKQSDEEGEKAPELVAKSDGPAPKRKGQSAGKGKR